MIKQLSPLITDSVSFGWSELNSRKFSFDDSDNPWQLGLGFEAAISDGIGLKWK